MIRKTDSEQAGKNGVNGTRYENEEYYKDGNIMLKWGKLRENAHALQWISKKKKKNDGLCIQKHHFPLVLCTATWLEICKESAKRFFFNRLFPHTRMIITFLTKWACCLHSLCLCLSVCPSISVCPWVDRSVSLFNLSLSGSIIHPRPPLLFQPTQTFLWLLLSLQEANNQRRKH